MLKIFSSLTAYVVSGTADMVYWYANKDLEQAIVMAQATGGALILWENGKYRYAIYTLPVMHDV